MLNESRMLRDNGSFVHAIGAEHHALGEYELYCRDADELLFTHNETNALRLFGAPNATPYVKDAFHEYIAYGNRGAVNPGRIGTKAAAHYARTIAPGDTLTIKLRLTGLADLGFRTSDPNPRSVGRYPQSNAPFGNFDRVFAQRQEEAEEFYAALETWPAESDAHQDLRRIQRQALAGMLWSKQFYHYDVAEWLQGDPAQPAPPPQRRNGRNREWEHLNTYDVISMPDKWEYP